MKLFDIFLISIYLHFCAMKERGRQIIPWFQTATAIALFASIAITLCIKLVFGSALQKDNLSETAFICGFMLAGVVIFFSIKQYLFSSGRHLTLSQEYLNIYSEKKRRMYKILSIGMVLAVPSLLGYFVWLVAKPL